MCPLQELARPTCALALPKLHGAIPGAQLGYTQGFQLSRIERESPAWTLFLPLSRQACKISRINEKIQPSM